MTSDLPALLEVFARNDVRFVAVGAFAVGIHGYVRMTLDLDIVPDPDGNNLTRLGAALTQVQAQVPSGKGFQPDEHGFSLRQGRNATLTTRVGNLDIIQRLDGVPTYTDLEARAVTVSIAGHQVRVCSLADLRAMKEAAGRPQDLLDLANLPEVDPS